MKFLEGTRLRLMSWSVAFQKYDSGRECHIN